MPDTEAIAAGFQYVLRCGKRDSGDAIEVLADELRAVDRAVELLDERDIAVVLADDVGGVLEHLRGRAQPAAIP